MNSDIGSTELAILTLAMSLALGGSFQNLRYTKHPLQATFTFLVDMMALLVLTTRLYPLITASIEFPISILCLATSALCFFAGRWFRDVLDKLLTKRSHT